MKRHRSISPPKGSSNKRRSTPTPPSESITTSASGRGRTTTPSTRPTAGKSNIDNRQEQHTAYKKWIQQQSHDYNTHQFLDASASVHAGLFGARRLPETKALWRQLVQSKLHTALEKSSSRSDILVGSNDHVEELTHSPNEGVRRPGQSGGGKISSRHLRRRTNSHKPRRRYRLFPSNLNVSVGGDDAAENNSNGRLQCAQSEFGASEDDTHGVSSSITNISGRNPPQRNKPLCRRARRKPSLLKTSHSTWWQPKTHAQLIQTSSAIDEECKYSVYNWIATHLWHAKRFHMSPKLFNMWSIPLIHCNRGSRASLRLASSETSPKCTIQDGTWEVNGCAITIEVCQVVGRIPPSHAGALPSKSYSTSSVQILVLILRRLCGNEAPFLNNEDVLAGKVAGEGIIHEIDACPLQPICPATFLFDHSAESSDPKSSHVGLLIHPATHQRVMYLLNKIVHEYGNKVIEVTLSTMPLALLRIRGRAATTTVQNMFGRSEQIGLINDDTNMHGTLIDFGDSVTNPPIHDSESISNKTLPTQSWLKLKCHQPNQNYQHLTHNFASSGWDIYCHPSTCSSLFQSFVVNGGACAIGLVEDARAQLEAYPPLPIFPRDYPDTEHGRLYWNGGASVASARSDVIDGNRSDAQWQDWVVIRSCVEGSWGRINTELKRTIRHWNERACKEHKKPKCETDYLCEEKAVVPKLVTNHKLLCRETVSINWESLTTILDNQASVVVRGYYGIPFLQLLHGCGKPFLVNTMKRRRKRRPRRTVRPPDWAVRASPLSNKETELHSSLCQQLSSSLSLPALLRCELYFEGKGTLGVGDQILPMTRPNDQNGSEAGDSDEYKLIHSSPLGVVTGGGFSPSRGKYHGIGFVSAAKLINALDGTVHGMGLVIPQSDGQRKMALKVMVVQGASVSRVALLSILL